MAKEKLGRGMLEGYDTGGYLDPAFGAEKAPVQKTPEVGRSTSSGFGQGPGSGGSAGLGGGGATT